ncbi:heterokaryon incompatibility protein-domain-containing protein [Podospora aff. communis PSN243]|uniref:Heterokaryon incompatibility protein-domain-containing protein n=1 Tax=Podospora aff. communis PSN243 TaxID=3040156 RepID=A0AAV9G3B9_9PEZI|nr:heterokaryon incompatibility protein-domain-containing protein [Podospora aff. communis PSN243]
MATSSVGRAQPQATPDCLCESCQGIPQKHFALEIGRNQISPRPLVVLGHSSEVSQRAPTCRFCRLVSHLLHLNLEQEDDPKSSIHVHFEGPCFAIEDAAGRSKGIIARVDAHGLEGRPWTQMWRRPIHSEHMNFDLVTNWVKTAVEPLGSAPDSTDLTLIDVLERRTVPGDASRQYAALSYVWGQAAKKFMAEKNNVHALCQPGSLSDDNENIPLVIRDAMLLVERIGQRYLWVDSICIVQDDDDISRQQVYIMDRIYADAAFVIIVLSAPHADAGIPGVRPGTRRYQSLVEEIGGTQLIASMDHMHMKSSLWPVFRSSVYATRGWTFQEHLLSSRRLYITKHQVYWEHDERVVAEDSTSLIPAESKIDPITDLRKRGEGDLNRWFGFYEFLVQSYTARTLGREDDDMLSAFFGISSRLESLCHQSMAAAIPLRAFHRALLFVPRRDSLSRRRIVAGKNYPSWSWLGWRGPVTYDFAGSHSMTDMYVLKNLISDARVMIANSDADLTSQPSFSFAPYWVSTFHPGRQVPCQTEDWACRNGTNPAARPGVTAHQTMAGDWDTAAYSRLESPVMLVFTALSAPVHRFTVVPGVGSSAREYQSSSLKDHSGTSCGSICGVTDDALEAMKAEGRVLKFVALSFGLADYLRFAKNPPPGDCGCRINLMLVSQDEKSRFAERIAVAHVESNAWWDAEPTTGEFRLV